MNGIDLITKERTRQLEAEGWTPLHDDEHGPAELTRAALSYADAARRQMQGASPEFGKIVSDFWPWESSWWKPSDEPIRNLVKAGALIAAEIDRLQRIADEQKP